MYAYHLLYFVLHVFQRPLEVSYLGFARFAVRSRRKGDDSGVSHRGRHVDDKHRDSVLDIIVSISSAKKGCPAHSSSFGRHGGERVVWVVVGA